MTLDAKVDEPPKRTNVTVPVCGLRTPRPRATRRCHTPIARTLSCRFACARRPRRLRPAELVAGAFVQVLLAPHQADARVLAQRAGLLDACFSTNVSRRPSGVTRPPLRAAQTNAGAIGTVVSMSSRYAIVRGAADRDQCAASARSRTCARTGRRTSPEDRRRHRPRAQCAPSCCSAAMSAWESAPASVTLLWPRAETLRHRCRDDVNAESRRRR